MSYFASIITKIFDAVAVSSTTVYTSAVLDVRNCSRISLQEQFVGTATGTWKFKISNDPQAVLPNGTLRSGSLWTTLSVPGAFSSGNPGGANLDFEFEFSQMGCLYLLAEYTNASGASTLNMWASAKA